MKSIKFKTLFLILLIFFSLFFIQWFVINFFIRATLERQSNDHVISLGKYIASTINANEIQTLPEYDKTKTYGNIKSSLMNISQLFNLDNIILMDINKRVIIDLKDHFKNGDEYLFIDINDNQFRHLRQGREQMSTLYKNIKGDYAENFYIPIRRNSKLKGVLLIFASVKYFGFLKILNRNIFYIFILFMVITIVSSYIFSISITKPVIKLSKILNDIGKGNLNKAIPYTKRRDEIGILAESTNEMLKKIKLKDIFMRKLSASLAHEIRNPLTAIKGNLMLLKRFVQNEEEKDMVEDNLNEVFALENLVNDFMNFAKPSEIHLLPIEIEKIITKALNETVLLANQKKIEFKSNIKSAMIKGDGNHLKRVFVNLLKNAIEASPIGEPIIIKGDIVNGKYELTFEDHGPGIAKEDMNSIFEPFFTTKAMGTGLGLPLVKEIIEKHNSRIFVENNSKNTTIFKILFDIYGGE
ncbi:HAMP domain-containing histidine kinase [bacterium]|nr:HAMP domain-containing histidine kinase [bacterium]